MASNGTMNETSKTVTTMEDRPVIGEARTDMPLTNEADVVNGNVTEQSDENMKNQCNISLTEDSSSSPAFQGQAKLTNDEVLKWMDYEEHYLEPRPPKRNEIESSSELDGNQYDPDVSSAFEVTLQSFGTTVDLGGIKTPSSTGTPPSVPETVPQEQPEASKPAKSNDVIPKKQLANETNGTPSSTTATGGARGKPASSSVTKKPSGTGTTPVKSATGGSPARPTSRRASAPQTPTTPADDVVKKVPMNKVKVGITPSPNIKEVKSKVGSLANTNLPKKPASGNVKIPEQKLAWKAESRVGSFNTNYVRKGGNVNVKVESKKVELKEVTSKVGSWNVAYKPGGGEKKIFDDKEYLKRTHSNSSSDHGGSAPHTPRPSSSAAGGVPTNGTPTGPVASVDTPPAQTESNLIDV